MPRFDPELLAAWTAGRWTARPAAPLLGFGADSRTLAPGQVFVALRTARRDGHDFLAAAAAAGAAAALVARPDPAVALPQLVVPDPLAALQAAARSHRRATPATIVGVTGSAGKTSTKELLARLLGGPPAVLATAGNLNNFLGVPLTLLRLEPGTARHAVIEAGINEPGEMRGLAAMIEPDAAILTLIGPAHLEKLGSLEAIAAEKSELLRGVRGTGPLVLPLSAWDYRPCRHLDAETLVAVPAGAAVPPARPRTRFITFGVEHSALQTVVVLDQAGAPRRFRLRRVSDGMAQNAVLALLLASALGVTDDELAARLAGWEPAPLRGEWRTVGEVTAYLDCYNANPASLEDSLAIFQQLAPEGLPRLYVLGSMEELGAAAEDYHRRVGAGLRLRPADTAFVLGSQAAALAEGLRAAGAAEAQVRVVDGLDPVRARLEGYRGAVFVKGSRRYQLETLWPEHADAAH